MSLASSKRDWEDLALVDPLWAILSNPSKRGGQWKLDEFFQTGEREISELLAVGATLGYPHRRRRALDFGCGVGRLTRALATHFEECYGLDISEEMIRRARTFNCLPNCTLLVNQSAELDRFQDGFFDLVCCNLVLQHLPSQDVVRRYLDELLRVLGPQGLLVFQLPYDIPWRNRLQLRRRTYHVLRALGCSELLLVGRLGLNPVRMIALSEQDVRATIERRGGVVARADEESPPGFPIRSLRYYVHYSETGPQIFT